MLVGLERKGAAEFSFLIAVPNMFVATGYELVKMHSLFATQDLAQFGVGFMVSFIVALVAVKTFVSFLGRWSLAPFAWYRIAIALVFYTAMRHSGL
jgi:undecaprenyl-diphosphatase